MQNERRIANTTGIYSLLINWAISLGALVIVPVISLFVSELVLPLVVFFIENLLYFYIRYNYTSKMSSCSRLPHLSMMILFWTTLVMVVINLLNIHPILDGSIIKVYHYIPVLIITPIAIIITLLNLRKGYNASICQDCLAHHGSVAERGFLGKLFSQEGEYLTKLMCMLMFVVGVISWIYYILLYINTNINDIDQFVYIWFFLILYIVSLIYLGIRYFSLWLYYCQNIDGKLLRYNSSSLIRYLIICGDKILLKSPDIEKDDIMPNEDKIDTPARLYIQYKKSITNDDAEMYFYNLSGISTPELRFLYENRNFNTECNIFHYAYIIEQASQIEQSKLEGVWYKLHEIKKLIEQNKVSPILASELERIYNVVLAWKGYDKKGKRLYQIKNYKPTFQLNDIKNWDVDYNDISWLFILKNNEDRAFFRVRKLWNKYICGIGIIKKR